MRCTPGTDRGVTIRARNLQLACDTVRRLGDRANIFIQTDMTHQNQEDRAVPKLPDTGGRHYLKIGFISTRPRWLAPASALLWCVHCPYLPTITRPPDSSSARANRWPKPSSADRLSRRQRLLPPSSLSFLNPRGFLPVSRPCEPTGSRDADANKGPWAVWSGRPTQREEGGENERQSLKPHKTLILTLSGH